MVKSFYWLIAGIVCLMVFSSSNNSDDEKFLRRHGFRYIPAGILSVNGSDVQLQDYYIFEAEVSNKQYREFLNDLKENGKTVEYNIARVDSLKWTEVVPTPANYIDTYHRDDYYGECPVVNISRKAALLYCSWLQEQLRFKIPNIEIRLPETNEWVYAAKGGLPQAIYAFSDTSLFDKDGTPVFNFKVQTSETSNYEEDEIYAPVYSYIPNGYGLFNTCGNAAEMVTPVSGTKGGSFNSDAQHIRIDGLDEYAGITEGSPYIGFRPVAIIR